MNERDVSFLPSVFSVYFWCLMCCGLRLGFSRDVQDWFQTFMVLMLSSIFRSCRFRAARFVLWEGFLYIPCCCAVSVEVGCWSGSTLDFRWRIPFASRVRVLWPQVFQGCKTLRLTNMVIIWKCVIISLRAVYGGAQLHNALREAGCSGGSSSEVRPSP